VINAKTPTSSTDERDSRQGHKRHLNPMIGIEATLSRVGVPGSDCLYVFSFTPRHPGDNATGRKQPPHD
jgi:hypothetical protein